MLTLDKDFTHSYSSIQNIEGIRQIAGRSTDRRVQINPRLELFHHHRLALFRVFSLLLLLLLFTISSTTRIINLTTLGQCHDAPQRWGPVTAPSPTPNPPWKKTIKARLSPSFKKAFQNSTSTVDLAKLTFHPPTSNQISSPGSISKIPPLLQAPVLHLRITPP